MMNLPSHEAEEVRSNDAEARENDCRPQRLKPVEGAVPYPRRGVVPVPEAVPIMYGVTAAHRNEGEQCKSEYEEDFPQCHPTARRSAFDCHSYGLQFDFAKPFHGPDIQHRKNDKQD